MGCCGCNNKTSATTAGILGLIQAVYGISISCYFLTAFHSVKVASEYFGVDAQKALNPLLISSVVIHSLWLLSSVLLLVGNSTEKQAWFVRQWVLLTFVIIVCDIVFPVVLALKISDTIKEILQNQQTVSGVAAAGSRLTYLIMLILAFAKLGIITIVLNICLAVFTYKRASDIQRAQDQGKPLQVNPAFSQYVVPAPYPFAEQQPPQYIPEFKTAGLPPSDIEGEYPNTISLPRSSFTYLRPEENIQFSDRPDNRHSNRFSNTYDNRGFEMNEVEPIQNIDYAPNKYLPRVRLTPKQEHQY